MATTSSTPKYGVARNLIGFRSTTLRVRIEREEFGMVWVRTADLLDAGTTLVLDAKQVEPETDYREEVQYKGGFVTFA